MFGLSRFFSITYVATAPTPIWLPLALQTTTLQATFEHEPSCSYAKVIMFLMFQWTNNSDLRYKFHEIQFNLNPTELVWTEMRIRRILFFILWIQSETRHIDIVASWWDTWAWIKKLPSYVNSTVLLRTDSTHVELTLLRNRRRERLTTFFIVVYYAIRTPILMTYFSISDIGCIENLIPF